MGRTHIVIHHSLTKDGLVPDWEAITRYHVGTNGWATNGYNFGIEQVDGEMVLREGRPLFMEGAHCTAAGMNRRGIGICVVGNFDEAAPSLRTLHFLRDACFALMVNHGIPAQNVIGHRDAGLMDGYDWRKGQYKSCPGRYFPMQALQDLLAGKLDREWTVEEGA